MRKPRGKYTCEKIKERRAKQEARQSHIKAVENGQAEEELPAPLFPDVFKDIQDTYWNALKSVPDPRSPGKRIYPLYLILHRIISGFLSGNKHIGVLFPKKRQNSQKGKKTLGALPTRKPVYTLLRRIDWNEANAILAPLWTHLGYTPDLVVQRKFRNPKQILEEYRQEKEEADKFNRNKISAERESEERAKGMSAAKAKQPLKRRNPVQLAPLPSSSAKTITEQDTKEVVKIRHDLVIDGKVVRASYNSGVNERFVHVTEIKTHKNDTVSRFIIGSRATELDRNGEWGAAMSVLDSLLPLPNDKVVLISGDAGFCVEEFCEWLTEKGFFLHFQD